MVDAMRRFKNFTDEMPPRKSCSRCPLEPETYRHVTPNCIQEPVIGSFNPSVEWTWNDNPVDSEFSVVEAPPIAINLNDDNGDGVIDAMDVPDILFPSFRSNKYRGKGHLIALSGATQEPLFVRSSDEIPFWGISGIAAGDVDNDGYPDIFAVTKDGGSFSHEGDFMAFELILSRGESIFTCRSDGNGILQLSWVVWFSMLMVLFSGRLQYRYRWSALLAFRS